MHWLNETKEGYLSSPKRLHKKCLPSGFNNKMVERILSITKTCANRFQQIPYHSKNQESGNSKKTLVWATTLPIWSNFTKENNNLPSYGICHRTNDALSLVFFQPIAARFFPINSRSFSCDLHSDDYFWQVLDKKLLQKVRRKASALSTYNIIVYTVLIWTGKNCKLILLFGRTQNIYGFCCIFSGKSTFFSFLKPICILLLPLDCNYDTVNATRKLNEIYFSHCH